MVARRRPECSHGRQMCLPTELSRAEPSRAERREAACGGPTKCKAMWPAEWIAAASAALSPAASLSGNAARWRRRRAEQHSCRRPLLRAR